VVVMMVMIVTTAAMAIFMVMMVLLMMVMVLFLMVVATAATTVLMMVVMLLVVMAAAALALFMVMVVMLLMVVTAAALAFLMVMVVMLLMVVTAAALAFLMVMVVMLLMVTMAAMMLHLLQILGNAGVALHSLQQLRAGELIPRSGNQRSMIIMLTEHCNSGIQLSLGDGIGTGKDDGRSGFDLVVVEFTEVLGVNLHLASVSHGYGIAQNHIISSNLLHSSDNIRQLTHTGRLDDHTIGMVLGNHFLQSLAEIAHQTAADAAGVHLGDVDASILQKAAIDADLTKFVLDEDNLLTTVCLADHLFDQGSFACAQKAGVNINFCHVFAPLFAFFLLYHHSQPVTSIFSQSGCKVMEIVVFLCHAKRQQKEGTLCFAPTAVLN
jgi:hypothetical protein